MEQKRIAWVDALKGYAIYMMMFSHIEFAPRLIKNFISPLFLAAFFVAAGYTFHSDIDLRAYFLKKCRTLLWPWLVFASFNILLTQILTFSKQEPLGRQFLHLFLQIRGENDGLWFFPCMFAVCMLYYLLDRLIPDRRLFFAAQPVLLLACMAYTLCGGNDLPWHVQLWGAGCFYMSIGYGYRVYEQRLRLFTRRSFLFITLALFLISNSLSLLCYPENHISFYDYGLSIPFYFIVMLSGMAFALSFVQLTPSFRIIRYAGRNSLMYFALHGKPKRLFTVLLARAGMTALHPLSDLLFAVLDAICLLYLLVIPCEIIRRYFPFLLGQKKSKGI